MELILDNRTCNQPSQSGGRCGRATKFFITGLAADGTHWGQMVCGTHDRSVARRNLWRWRPKMSRNEIVAWDMDMTRE